MQSAPLRDDEAQSLAALRALEVLDSGPEAQFDALVRAASIVCGVPISLLSLIDVERQWFKANIGLPGVNETPRDLAFCAHAVLGDELFEVPDATQDPRFSDNPLVTSRPDIRFYAGAPVRLSDGTRIGTLCVIDRQPQRLTEVQRQVLMELAAAAAQALEGRRAVRAIQQVSREVAQSEARFRLLSETVPIGVFELNTQGDFIFANERLLAIFGAQRSQGLDWTELVHADDHARIAALWGEALAQRRDMDAEFRIRLADGRERQVRANAKLRLNEAGRPSGYVGTVEDVTEARRQQDALRTSQAFLDRTGRLAGVGGWEVDLINSGLYWSPETCRIHGLEAGYEPSLEEALVFYTPAARPVIQQAVEHAVASGEGFDLELQQELRDGRQIWVRAVGSVEFEGGRAMRLVGAFQDTTKQKHIEAELREAKLVAEAASKAKSEFLANMSHEIRTPMNAILGMLTLLRKTPMSERQADYAGKTEGAARALLGLLNEILDFSKVEAGKMELDPQPMRVDHVLRDLSVILAANVGAKKLALEFDIDPALPRVLVADAMRLQQVLINLTGNAIKFTEQGEVVLTIQVLQQDRDAVRLRFAVRDTGIGIAPENQARIFTGFTQAEASTTRRFGGTGLGLAISQRLVALMGGELTLHSELGRGSCFEFSLTLPLGDAEAELLLAPAAAPVEPQRLAGMRLLLVEDNPNNQQVAAELLQGEGASVQIAGDGQQAVTALADDPSAFDVVLMDLQMPVMDGYAATRHLREVLGLRALPIVAMTANAMSSDRAACLAAGMNDHIGKPFDLDELVRVLRQQGGRANLGVARPAAQRPPELADELSRAAAAAAVDLPAALQRMGGKAAVYARMLRNFTVELGALQAQLREHLAQADAASAVRLLHTLKGVAATLGAGQLAAQAERGERALMEALSAGRVTERLLLDCVESSCVAIACAVPGLSELLRVMQAGEGPAPADAGLSSLWGLPAAEQQDLLKTLGDLLLRLQDSDMEALHLMSVLQARYAAVLGGRLQGLDELLGRLDFQAAIAPCQALLSEVVGIMP